MEKRMALRVCQVCAVDFTVEKFLLSLIDGMLKEGWEVTTVCSDGTAIPRLIDRGYTFKTIPIARSMNPFKALRSLYLLYDYFKNSNFDIIHVHTPVASFLARIAVHLSKSQSYVIYTAHGFYFHDEMNIIKKLMFIYVEKIAARYTDLLFCQSKEDASSAAEERIMPIKDIITIGNGVDRELFNLEKYQSSNNELRADLNIPIDAKVIGIVARKVKEKGYIEFLQAAVNLKKNHNNLYFLLIGDKLESDHDSGIEQALYEAKNVLKECLIDLGHRDDIPQLISVMDIFCLPSYREGLPRTIIEAMFLKKPIVATDIRGCREEVVHGQTGLLVPVKNINALSEALEYLLNNYEIAISMGERGYSNAVVHFDEKNIVDLQISSIKKRLFFKY